ncbi:inactive peptidyl-prolyl cis-trans isomerase FKBP6 isoform X3 [Rhincodon typus]|uniref:inactive peptidyl-prolyl cis-trans isomerase FKBP6 isoform X3 n=1 Tax=Rhincodon typus TaxID=259920 RepID=UPI00202F125A|nr:inactive peptidyl-prolyl cis-trans isomerase FKBP6 isoform X3 [Rhincodon typus]
MNGPPPSPHGHLNPFYYMSQRMQDVTGDGGVLKEILRPGSGSVIPSTASVSVHYSAYSEYTDKPFDSNVQRDVPRFMKLGRDITLLGMELAIQTMRKGEFARFLFKPQYAYGQMGCPPRIPANATVMFELEILHFVDTMESDEYFMLSQEEQITYPVEKLLKVASTEREFGNYFFQLRRYEDAKDQYKKVSSDNSGQFNRGVGPVCKEKTVNLKPTNVLKRNAHFNLLKCFSILKLIGFCKSHILELTPFFVTIYTS